MKGIYKVYPSLIYVWEKQKGVFEIHSILVNKPKQWMVWT
jgi:hypothetical protein